MRKIVPVIMVCAATLGGCANFIANPAGTITTFVSEVQAATAALCAVEPTAASVAALISASPAVVVASEIAGTICKAVTAAQSLVTSHRGGRLSALKVPDPVIINGVTVQFEPVTK